MRNLLDKLLGTSNTAGAPTLTQRMSATMQELVAPTQTTQEVIDEIHHSFYTAGDKLLAEAQAVIAGTDEGSFAKTDRLKALGFSQAKGVQETEAVKADLSSKKAMQQLLTEYAVKYPTYRFIDEAGIEAICKKYNLVFGNITDYKGFVPEKNLAEIERFPGVKEEDAIDLQRMYYKTGGWSNKPEVIKYGDWRPVYRASNDEYRIHMLGSRGMDYEFRNSKKILICAPIKDMNMVGKELDGHKVVVKLIPDPVVLVPMKGNLFCILTAWGDEASDPLVVKQGLN